MPPVKVHIFLRLDLCYNTGHDSGFEFHCGVRLHASCNRDRDRDIAGTSESRACEPRAREKEDRYLLHLSQLLDRVERTPL
jgi:hypothetical protein